MSFWLHSEKRWIQFVQQICSLSKADLPIEFWFLSYFSAGDRKDIFFWCSAARCSEDKPNASAENTKQKRILGVSGWSAQSLQYLKK